MSWCVFYYSAFIFGFSNGAWTFAFEFVFRFLLFAFCFPCSVLRLYHLSCHPLCGNAKKIHLLIEGNVKQGVNKVHTREKTTQSGGAKKQENRKRAKQLRKKKKKTATQPPRVNLLFQSYSVDTPRTPRNP